MKDDKKKEKRGMAFLYFTAIVASSLILISIIAVSLYRPVSIEDNINTPNTIQKEYLRSSIIPALTHFCLSKISKHTIDDLRKDLKNKNLKELEIIRYHYELKSGGNGELANLLDSLEYYLKSNLVLNEITLNDMKIICNFTVHPAINTNVDKVNVYKISSYAVGTIRIKGFSNNVTASFVLLVRKIEKNINSGALGVSDYNIVVKVKPRLELKLSRAGHYVVLNLNPDIYGVESCYNGKKVPVQVDRVEDNSWRIETTFAFTGEPSYILIRITYTDMSTSFLLLYFNKASLEGSDIAENSCGWLNGG